jgi:hypothetical protein
MGLPILVHGRRFFVSRSRLPDKEAKRPPHKLPGETTQGRLRQKSTILCETVIQSRHCPTELPAFGR